MAKIEKDDALRDKKIRGQEISGPGKKNQKGTNEDKVES